MCCEIQETIKMYISWFCNEDRTWWFLILNLNVRKDCSRVRVWEMLSSINLTNKENAVRNDSLVTTIKTRHTSLQSCLINIVFSYIVWLYVYFHTKYNGYDLNGFLFPTSNVYTWCNFLKQICFLPAKLILLWLSKKYVLQSEILFHVNHGFSLLNKWKCTIYHRNVKNNVEFLGLDLWKCRSAV